MADQPQTNATVAEWIIRGPVKPVPIGTKTAGSSILSTAADLIGWSLKETTGAAAATVNIYNGTSNKGTLVAALAIPSGSTDRYSLDMFGVYCDSGIYLDVVSGSVTGSVWARW